MNSIIKGAIVCVSCFVGGALALIWLVLDAIFKLSRIIRYGFIRLIAEIASFMEMNDHNTKTCNNILNSITSEDIKNAIKIKNLKL